MELYLIRHTTPDIKAGICYGQSDIDVAAIFETEADTVLRKFNGRSPEVVYTSPSQRCLKLASTLAQAWECNSPTEDARLMELHFGEWEMKSWLEICPQALERWGTSYIHEAPPGGETFLDLHRRVQDFLADLHAYHVVSAAVVTHAGVIRAMLAEATGKPLSETFAFELSYGGVTHIQCQAQALQVVRLNA